MKTLLTSILLFFTANSFGQANFQLDSTTKMIDSLFKGLSSLATSVRKHQANIPAYSGVYTHAIKNVASDSAVIYFFDGCGQLLFKKINRYNAKGCRWWETDEIYTGSGKLSYRQAWKWSCIEPHEKTDHEALYFDAMIYEKESFAYDSSGRLKQRVWWYAPLGDIRKYTYSYDHNNNQSYKRINLAADSFWD